MNDAKFIIVGANGQLGKALQVQYPGALALDSTQLDITDSKAVESFNWGEADYIINAAGYTNVDGAETFEGRKRAWQVNAAGTANLAKAALNRGKTLVHISTDYVFDGSIDLHTETEEFTPISVYGSSKAAGDIAVTLLPKHYILRTSWVIGDGKNFVRTMMSLAEKNISPTVVHDQIGRLTFTSELTRAIDHLLNREANYGTYNVSNSGQPSSWADITREVFKQVGRDDLTVTNTTTAEYYAGKDGIAPRPLQSTLALDKLESTGFAPTDWRTALQTYITEGSA